MSTTFDTNPTFHDNVGQILSATDLDIIRDNVASIDAQSFRRLVEFDSSGTPDTGTPGTYDTSGPSRVWYGYFRWRTGMTDLTIKGRTIGPSGRHLTVYVNGISAATIAMPSSGFTEVIDISTGYSDGQIVPIEIVCAGTGSMKTGTVVIQDIYADPISLAGFPGVPTFTTATINATKLNQLCDATEWLYDRMNAVPLLPSRLPRTTLAPFRTGDEKTIWYGTIQRGFSAESAQMQVFYSNFTGIGYRYKIYVAGVLTVTGTTNGIGSFGDIQTISLSGISVGDTVEVKVTAEVVTEPPGGPFTFSRFSVLFASTTAAYPYATMPSEFVYGALSPADLVTALNALGTILTAAKTRIDAAPHVFGRARAVRRWYGYNDDTRGSLDKRAPIRFIRRGDRLVVKGKGVQLCWGPVVLPTNDRGVDYDGYTFTNTEQLIDTDKTDTREIYLDSYPALYPNTQYFLLGDVQYAEELLS